VCSSPERNVIIIREKQCRRKYGDEYVMCAPASSFDETTTQFLPLNESMTVLRATIFETLPRAWKYPPKTACFNTTVNHSPKLANFHQSRKIMASSNSQINASKTLVDLPVSDAIDPDNIADYGVENTDIKTASGITLSDTQRLLAGSVLDVSFRSGGFEFAK
jgi:hypothetical protein